MAQSFSVSQVKNLIKLHSDIFNALYETTGASETYKQLIANSIQDYSNHKVMEILQSIPIEELNRDKDGIRISALRKAGYTTIADVAGLNATSLSLIKGVGDSSAYSIKRVARKITEEARSMVRLRLSLDSQDELTSKIVLSVYQYRLSLEENRKSTAFYLQYYDGINNSLNNLRLYVKKKKFFFVSKSIKQNSEIAYNYLNSLSASSYLNDAQIYIDNASAIKNADVSYAWQDFAQASITYFNIIEEIAPDILGSGNSLYGLPEELAREIQDECFFPEGLLCQLRRYQEWGVKYILHQGRVLLGDEMGLGKTVQAIATMVSLKNTGATHFMVICPASVLENWCREIRQHSLLRVTQIHGAKSIDALECWLDIGGVAVTTYETTSKISIPDNHALSLVIVDEAHYIKNPDAARTKNTKNICSQADRLLFMTGTALENKVDEMVALIKILQPSIAAKASKLSSVASAAQFRNEISPVYYRRKREDVLTELPEKTEIAEWCIMGAREEYIYEEAVLNGSFNDARRVSWHVPDLRISSKAQRMRELIDEAESDGRKVIVFSFFRDTIHKVYDLLEDRCLQPITGSIAPSRRQQIVDEFEAAPAGSVLIAQIQAGGTGLNIQSASVVFICEPQYKPSIENQAISRAYRMGQTRDVLVYRLLCKDSVDERIMQLLQEKQREFDAFADKSVAAEESLALDESSLNNIIKEEIDRINAKRGIV